MGGPPHGHRYDEELEDFVIEVDILTVCKHEGVIGLIDAVLWNDNLWVLLELCEGGALDDVLIELEQGLAENQIACIGHQTTGALEYLHNNMVIHRDLKAGWRLLPPPTALFFFLFFSVSSHFSQWLLLLSCRIELH
jgi:serine/threonine protein kinase